MHEVAVLVMDSVVPFDFAVGVDGFNWTGRYRVRVCGPKRTVKAELFELKVPHGLELLSEVDTIVLPGHDPDLVVPERVLEALRQAAARGARIASICTGAFVFAATGLLDGLRVTTHWLGAEELQARHPEIEVDPDVLYVDNGQFLTSAGAAAGLDLCLHMIRRDHGSAVAADAARMAVMPLEREGGQAQFIVTPPATPQGAELEPVLRWMEANAARDLTLVEIAGRAGMSTRTLNRRFREQTGTTPLQWLHRARIRNAQHLLETTRQPVEVIAGKVGFGSATAFRDRFKRIAGTSPQNYRAAFQQN
ncbi:AraC family transcriptional regulator [Lentzea aerocolonigenes]|uniref:AraC family transcriptional regulator n=1 Tax=Lentzea aerocolonigenes TaxID=68170 RepID=A0A0F0GW53_LENAE|nr:helix-turn-helix domain-containing protein [Lentzea aerocolonigenes]KJK47515.1 AraC family transcriptional regulator [Lentzea aerocolonigenes]